MNRSHIPTLQKASVEEKPNKKKIRILQVLLIVSSLMFTYGVAGVAYTLMSNHSHAYYSRLDKPYSGQLYSPSLEHWTINIIKPLRECDTGSAS